VLEGGAEARVVAIGLGGSEGAFPINLYAPIFDRARNRDLRTVAHAGEAAGPESVWTAIRALRVDRIGHGTRSVEDPMLLAYLSRQSIPLEICVSSNLRLGVVPTLAKHPICELYRAGVIVTLSSDDPAMFGTDLIDECRLLHEGLAIELPDLLNMLRTGFEQSFLSEVERRTHLDRFDAAVRSWRERGP
jgi:adenosine deaminase